MDHTLDGQIAPNPQPGIEQLGASSLNHRLYAEISTDAIIISNSSREQHGLLSELKQNFGINPAAICRSTLQHSPNITLRPVSDCEVDITNSCDIPSNDAGTNRAQDTFLLSPPRTNFIADAIVHGYTDNSTNSCTETPTNFIRRAYTFPESDITECETNIFGTNFGFESNTFSPSTNAS
ncbi:hypothetical protein FQN57_004051 [Myotisia sp. PD_48]|nr:hypothetical protein FQN57_004051 [Myotisia sp. PD_48]